VFSEFFVKNRSCFRGFTLTANATPLAGVNGQSIAHSEDQTPATRCKVRIIKIYAFFCGNEVTTKERRTQQKTILAISIA
jgi:hypothetical protein